MLNPNDNRLDYGKILAPPEGYYLDFAIGTTYSLDLDALIGASIALGLSEDTDSDLMKNPICLLEALRATGDKVALFCETGQIHMPNNVTPLYILLERMVFQINTAKRKGIAKYPSFHPKFWLLRYVDKKKVPVYRVAVLSRNLTFDRSWDIAFFMDGTVGKQSTLKNEPLADFILYLSGSLSANESGKLKQKKIKEILRELSFVHFDLESKEFEDYEFLPVGIEDNKEGFHSIGDKGYGPLFTDSFHEMLVISPFLTGSVIREFNDRSKRTSKAECMLITRAMSLDKLRPDDCTNFRIFTMKDAVVDGESEISESESHSQKQDIHAKVYMVRKNTDSYLYLGSLNASHNAMYGNVEFMIMLKSKNKYLNLSKLSEALFDGKEEATSNPFHEVSLSSLATIDEEQETQSNLENFIKEVTRMKPCAIVSENGDYYDISVQFTRYKECGVEVNIAPLLSNKSEKLAENVQFSSLQLTQLSEFFKIVVSDGERTVQRVVVIHTEGLPEDREKAVVNSVVKDKECFYRYIAFLLGDNYILGALEANNTLDNGRQQTTQRMVQIPALYEKMLQTASVAPERFKEIDYLMKAISSDGVIPDKFEELYNMFKKAVKL